MFPHSGKVAELSAQELSFAPLPFRVGCPTDAERQPGERLGERQAAADQSRDDTKVRDVAAKLLSDHAVPKAGDRLASGVDADARWGKHGDYYVGYLLDVAMDADSELITGVNVLPANGDEGADTVDLLRQEQAAQGNNVEAVSIDGAAPPLPCRQ